MAAERGGDGEEGGGDRGEREREGWPARPGRREREREHPAEREEGEHPQAPDVSEAGAEHVADDVRRERRPGARRAGGRALQDDPGAAGDDARGGSDEQRGAQAPGERRRRLAPRFAGARRGAQGRPPDREQERQAAQDERGREIGQPAGDAERGLGDRAGGGVADELGDGRGRRRAGRPDREDQAAGDRVAVGGDDAVRGDVGAVGQARLQADGQPRAAAAGMRRAAVVDPPGRGVEDADGAEVALDGLAEVQHHRARLRLQRRAALGHGVDEQRVGRGGGGREQERREQPAHDAQRPPPHGHQASWRGFGLSGSGAPAPDDDHRGPAEQGDRPEGDVCADRRARVGTAPEQRSGDRARRARGVHGHPPVDDLRALGLVGDLLGNALGHPVHPVVVELVTARAGDDLPLRVRPRRSGGRRGGHLRAVEAVLVEVVRRRAQVDLDRAAGAHADVRVLAVAVDRDGARTAVLDVEAVVAVEHLHPEAGDRRRHGVDERLVVRVALVGEGGCGGNARRERAERSGTGDATDHRRPLLLVGSKRAPRPTEGPKRPRRSCGRAPAAGARRARRPAACRRAAGCGACDRPEPGQAPVPGRRRAATKAAARRRICASPT